MKRTRTSALAVRKPRAPRARRPVIEEIEPRILYSADFSPGLVETTAPLDEPEQRLLDGSGEFVSVSESTALQPNADTADSGDTAPQGTWELELLLGDETATTTQSGQPSVSAETAAPQLSQDAEVAVASTPLAFERNDGQTDAQVDFLARGSGYAVWLTGGDAVIALEGEETGHVLRLDVLGGNPDAVASGADLLAGTSNYLLGPSEQWQTDVANYAAVYYDEVYDGIDLRYYGNQRRLEYDFILDAGAQVSDIRLAFDGAQDVSVADTGDLVLDLGDGQSVVFQAPIAWQEGADGREAVVSRYVLFEDGSVGFEVGAYDHDRELVIDPVFSYGTYLGGSGTDQVLGMAVDGAGYVYLTGSTASSNFPVTAGAFRVSDPGGQDAFVTKLTADLSAVVYSTYLGGDNNDEAGYNIAVDAAGNAYVTGYTKSNDFPTLAAFQSSRNGSQDVFVTKVNAAGNGLVYSTYLGGNGSTDTGYWIVVDGSGSAYVGGYATASDFPVTAGAADTSFAGGEGFVTKFSGDGSSLVYSTFIGGENFDAAYSIAVDAAGNVAVVGETASNNFPVTASAYQTTSGGNSDIFMARLNAAGSAITYATYLGGSGADQAFAVAFDGSGRIYLTGETASNNFDVTAGALQINDGGKGDAFLSVIDSTQSGAASLVYSTYIGGSKANERAWNVTVDAAGRAYLAGSTDSDDFPTTANAYRTTRAGSDDVFILQINPVNGGASDLLYSSYFGGSNSDSALTGVYANGKLYFGGATTSNNSIATAGASDTSYNGAIDGFVAAFSFAVPPIVTVNATPLAYSENAGAQLLDNSITVTDADSPTLTGATLQFTANYALGEDSLTFNNSNPWGITGVWSAAAGRLTLSGSSSVADYQTALRSVTYTNISQKPSTLTRSVTITASDGGSSSAAVVRQINVASINDVPSISAPASQTLDEDGTLIFSSAGANAIAVSDVDAGTSPVQLTVTATNGTLTLFQTIGLSFTSGDGAADASMTFTGTIPGINAALNGLRYTPATNYNGAASVQINMSDLGNSGSPGPQIANRAVAVTVAAVNDAPQNNVPGPQSTQQNTPLVFSAAGGNAIALGDVDAGAGELRVTLNASNGVLALGSSSGLSLVLGDGTGAVTIAGTLGNLNAALDGLRFTPAFNYNGSASLNVVTDDQSNSGSGGALSDSDTIAITVSNNVPPSVTLPGGVLIYAENDPPTAIAPSATVSDPDNPQLAYATVRISAGYVDGEDELWFADPGGLTGVWDAATGTLSISGAAAPSVYEAALRSVTYRNLSDNPNTAARTLSFVVNDGIADGPIATRSVQVGAVNDPPAILAPLTQNVNEDTPLVFSATFGSQIAVSDVDAGNGVMEVSLSVTDGILTLAQTGGLTMLAGGDGSAFMTFSGSLADVNAALNGLRFDPDADYAGPADLDIAVSDLGNSGSGGPGGGLHTVSIDVGAINDAPHGFDDAILATEDNDYVFSVADFGFTDPSDVPGDKLLAVRISVLPGGGTLTLSGVPVASGGFISEADIAAGRLVFTPMPDAYGSGYTTLGYQVQDDGGTAGGGVDLDPVVRTLTIDVAGINDAPVNMVSGALTADEDTPLALSGVSVDDIDGNLSAVQLSVASGVLNVSLAGGAAISGGANGTGMVRLSGSQMQINDALSTLVYQGNANFNGGDALTVLATDAGGLTDSDSVAITVNAVNDAPSLSALADVSIAQGSSVALAFTVGDVETAAGSLTVTATSSNPALLPDANITLGGSGANRSVLVNPLASQYGSATVTVNVSDGTTITQETFTLTVIPPNLPPTVSPTVLSVAEGAANGTAVGTVTASDPDPETSFSKIYWADYAENAILRANLDGSGEQTLVSGLSDPVGVAVDYLHGKIYWTDVTSNKIQRANLDGSGVQDVVTTGLSNPFSIEVDADGGKIYWADQATQKIQRANLDGTGLEDLLTSADGLSSPTAIALDPASGKLYWVDDGSNRVQRANLDGSGAEILVSGLTAPGSIALDLPGGKMYWTDSGTSRIARANLDGSSPELSLLAVSNGVNGLAIDSARGKLYWTEDDNNRIRSANLDGSGATTILNTGLLFLLSDPAGIALGPAVQGLSYTIVAGNTGGAFAIDAQTGAITVANGSVLDLEARPSYALTVQVQDAGGMTGTGTVTINLTNVNEAPAAIALSSASVNEGIDTTAGYTVGTLATTDLDTGDSHTYSVVGGADAANFSIAGATLRIADGVLDFETKASYQVTVRSTDSGGLTVDRTFTIAVLNMNDAPVNSVPGAQSTAQNTPLVFSAGNGNAIAVADADLGGGSLQVTLTATNGTLLVGPAIGSATVAGDGTATVTITGSAADVNSALSGLSFAPDFNYNGAANLQITTDDQGNTGPGGSLSETDSIAIAVANNVPAGVIMTGGALTYTENDPPTVVDPNLTVTDPDSPQLDHAHVTIIGGYVNGQDLLEYVFNPALPMITASWNAAAGELTLAGAASAAEYQQALRTVTYRNLSERPNTAVRTITVEVEDGISVDAGSFASRTLNVISVNDAPVLTVPVAQTASEDAALVFSSGNGNAITIADADLATLNMRLTLSATNGTLTLATTTGLTFNAGGDGTGGMTVTGTRANLSNALNDLRFDPTGDYSGAASVTVTVDDLGNTGTGGALSDSESIAVNVLGANDAPVITSDGGGAAASRSVIENNTFVTDVDAADIDIPVQALAYSIAGGADAGRFTIDALSGVLSFLAAPDREAPTDADLDSIYEVTLRVSDGNGGIDLQSLTVTVLDADEFNVGTVTDTDAAANGVAENAANGTVVGVTALASDADATTNAITYTLDDDAGGRFAIGAGTGVVSVADGSLLDREAAGSHSITVRASSADGSFSTQGFSIALTDVDEFAVGAIADTDAGANGAAENSPAGTLVGITALASDADATANTIGYSLDDDAGGLFAVDAVTGAVSVAGMLDAETAVSHSITLRAVSADGSFSTQTFAIAVTDVNDMPVGPVTDADPAADMVLENTAPGAAVGIGAIAVDGDLTSTAVGYSLDDDAGGRFAIDAITGVVTAAAALDHEAAPSHDIVVRATSADGTFSTGLFTIAVGDVNEAPAANDQTFAIDENSSAGSVVGLMTALDPDAGDVSSWSILAGNTGGAFAIDPASGQITVASSAALDFETGPAFTLTVQVLDAGGLGDTATVTVNLNDMNDPPIAVDDAVAMDEDSVLNVTPAGVLANDSDLDGGALTVSAVDGNPADVGNTITLSSGALLRLNADGSFSYDPNGAFDWLSDGATDYDGFSYEVSDSSGGIGFASVTVAITGVNDAPAGADGTVSAVEDTPYAFSSGDFGFLDVDGTLQAVTIQSLPAQGSLTLAGAPVAAGAVVTEAQIAAGQLVFSAAPNQNGAGYASFAFRVSDGLASAAAANTMSIDVAAVSDLPVVAPSTIAGSEDVVLTFTLAHFAGPFTDVDGDTLVQVRIASLPGNGVLALSGMPVAVNDVIALAQLSNLAFTPTANWNGSTLFAWHGHDGSGYSVAAADMTLAVAPVNDAPVLNAGAAGGSVAWAGTMTLSSSVLRADDVDDAPTQLVYTVGTLPGGGALYRGGVALAVNGTFTQSDIDSGQVAYVHGGVVSGGDSFMFTVADAGGGSIGSTAFAISVGSPPPPPVVVAPPPPPPPPSDPGTEPAPDPGSTEPAPSDAPADTGSAAPAPGEVPVSQALETALMGAPTNRATDVDVTRTSANTGPQRVHVAQVLGDRSLISVLSIRDGTLAPMTVGVGEAPELSVSGTLLSTPAFLRSDLSALESVASTLGSTEFVGELDTMRDQLDGKIEVQDKLVASGVAVSGGLSVGYVIWLLRGGLLLSSLLSSLPAWHAVDPMPVLARGGGDDDEEGADEDPLERLFGKAKDALLGGLRGRAADPEPPPSVPAEVAANAASRAETNNDIVEANA